jgi:GT2 family glycosyltransferase
MKKPVVVIPNLNGGKLLLKAVDSLKDQTLEAYIIIVDNASTDGSAEKSLVKYPDIELIKHDVNKGYAGGVNPGMKRAIELGSKYVAPFNNDAVADKEWLEKLVNYMDSHDEIGVAACKLLDATGSHIDSTGDYYTNWGLPYPRGRGENDIDKYDDQTEIFAASGGASVYRVDMLKQIGLLDEDFFAYYEDVDLSFRAQLSGWKVSFVPTSVAYHQIGATSAKIKGFRTYQTMKNQPLLLMKNMPRRYLFSIGWRFTLAHCLFFIRAIQRGQGWSALKGDYKGTLLLFSGFSKRRAIQHNKVVTDEYIWDCIVHDLPPNAKALRKLRSVWWKILRKKS